MRLRKAEALFKQGELDLAWKVVEQYLEGDPSCPLGLALSMKIADKANHTIIAYQYGKRLTELKPNVSTYWTLHGVICDKLWLIDESEAAHKKALDLATTTGEAHLALMNLGAMYVNTSRFALGEEYSLKALEIDPYHNLVKSNLGLCQLARGEWKEGFRNFSFSLGSKARRRWEYSDEPQWDGSRVGTLIVYGEEGLGDEIMFASMIPDAISRVQKVVVDCDKRLEILFRRSFPCKVYGTRWETELRWDAEDQKPDASVSMGQLGEFFRQKDSDFPVKAYLTPDPDRLLMWKALYARSGKPVIGIAWSGGVKHTAAAYRRLNLMEFMPLFQSIDAHWISLEYKDRSKEIASWNAAHPEYRIHAYPQVDYDDTAAMIAGMDAFAGIHTTAMHCAGALGLPVFALVSKYSNWRYARSMPWYPNITLFRQRGDYWPMRELAKALNEQLRRVEDRHCAVA